MTKTERVKPGDVFGRLTVSARDVEREQAREALGRRTHPYFKCRCECGNEISADMYRLLSGAVQSCGCARKRGNATGAKDLTGQTFGRLTVIGRDYEHEATIEAKTGRKSRIYYKCKCTCGNVRTVLASQLIGGRTKSCGCLKKDVSKELGKSRVIDLTGMTFGNITVIKRDDTARCGCGKHAYWIGICSLCGGTKSFRGSDLTSGKVTDCGCMTNYKCGLAHLKDLTGMKFGHLEVLERDMTVGTKSGQHARWWCKCGICGSVESVVGQMLTVYGKDRCSICNGGVSIGEQKIMELLDEHDIPYAHDKRLGDCIYPESGGVLFFDFIIGEDDNTYVIEFDGLQHFREVPQWDHSIDLIGRKRRDEFKNVWCAEHNIPMIRIPYTHLKSMCYEDLRPETTTFLVS